MDDANFNPYEHRQVEGALSNFDALVFLLNCVLGTGLLAMPLAYKFSGLAGGTALIIFSTIVLTYGIHLLIHCMLETARRTATGYASYTDTMVYSFTQGPKWCHNWSRTSGLLVDVVLGFSHYGISVVYIVFVAYNWKQFLDYYWDTIELKSLIIAVGVCLTPLFLIRDLKVLVPFHIIAHILMYTGLAAIFYFLFQDLPPITDRKLVADPWQLPLVFSIVLYAVTSVGVMLAIESNMEKPQSFLGCCGLLNCSTAFIIVINVIFGLIGYWRYGDKTRASISLNLPTNETISQYSKFATAMSTFLTYPLAGFVTIDIIMNHYILKDRKPKHPHMIEYTVRLLFVLLGTLNAMALPYLGPLVAVVGAFCVSIINLIFPAIIELCLRYNVSYGLLKWRLYKNFLMILAGSIILFSGTYSAIRIMVREYGTAFPRAPDNEYIEPNITTPAE